MLKIVYYLKIIGLFFFVSNIIAFQNDRIMIFPFKVYNVASEQRIMSRLKNELNNLGFKNLVSQNRIEYFLNQMEIDSENCNDSCLYTLGQLADADKIISGHIFSDSNNYSIKSSLHSVSTQSIITDISYNASDEIDLNQFGVYYIARGLTGQNLSEENGGKMHTVSIKSLYINEIDFFKLSNGDPYPVIFVLTENSIPIWKISFSNLRGYRTVNEKKILSFVPEHEYKVIIYDAKLKQLSMEYIIEAEPNGWPFATHKNKIGKKSYILFNQKFEKDFYFMPNKKI